MRNVPPPAGNVSRDDTDIDPDVTRMSRMSCRTRGVCSRRPADTRLSPRPTELQEDEVVMSNLNDIVSISTINGGFGPTEWSINLSFDLRPQFLSFPTIPAAAPLLSSPPLPCPPHSSPRLVSALPSPCPR